jgi:hypothetical protein
VPVRIVTRACCVACFFRTLKLQNNRLNGSIPGVPGPRLSLTGLDFSNNSLSGPIPVSITELKSVQYVNRKCMRASGSGGGGCARIGFSGCTVGWRHTAA